MIANIQDEDLAKADLRDQERLEHLRSPWEASWREIDERFPHGAGGFNRETAGNLRSARNFDSQHILSLRKFAAAGVAITTPEQDDYIRPKFLDDDLNRERSVELWRSKTGRRIKQIRHAAHTGFATAANEDWDQLGRYGTSGVWQEAGPRGMIYRCLHLSELYIDVDFSGLVDRVHRKLELSARQCEDLFGLEALTEKMRDALKPGSNKENEKFAVLHVVAPNRSWDREALDHSRFPIGSRYLAMDEKVYLRRKGYRTMPVSVSRHTTSPGEIYGRSPAFDVLPNIQGVQAMKHTTLRAAHKAVDPALAFHNDGGATKMASKPGGMNPGFVDEMGRLMVHRMPGGENGLPIALEMIEAEKDTIRIAFLEEFYKILTDPNSRMTTTEVLEVMSKQGVLVRPYASRYETEKQHPMTQRDLELMMAAGQVEEFPPEVQEAGAWPLVDYENPLAAMSRAENTAKTLRFMQALPILAEVDPAVRLRVDAEAMAKGMAEEIGVKPEYIRSDEAVAKLKANEEAAKGAMVNAELLEKSAGAVKDLAQAGAMAA
jgi:hypothetical protein